MYFPGIPDVWIGLKDKTWMTGESFDNVYGIKIRLNNYDSGFTNDPEVDCGKIGVTKSKPLQDQSCNRRKKQLFVCEIVLP